MKHFAICVLLLLSLAESSLAQRRTTDSQLTLAASSILTAHVQPYFIENKGQWGSEVKFLFRSGGMDMWITDHGVIYDIHDEEIFDTNCNPISIATRMDPRHHFEIQNQLVERTGHVVRMDFAKSTTTPLVTGTGQQIGIYNYFIGNDSTKWVTNVHTYSGVTIENLYPGVDAVFYLDNGTPRYDLRTKPGADLSQIEMQWERQDALSLDNCGNLAIKTMMGDLMQSELLAYQVEGGLKEQVACKFKLGVDGTVRFDVGKYDLMVELIIDPLVYSTYLGGSGDDFATGIALNAAGEAFITGYTTSNTTQIGGFPTTSGAYQIANYGVENAFVSKLNATGTGLVYSTYIGGSLTDLANSIVIDQSGNAYITGFTNSHYPKAYPTTAGVYQSVNNGSRNAFVTKLNSTGDGLIYSTLIGGALDQATGIAIDTYGDSYITGFSDVVGAYPLGYPTTAGAFQTLNHGGYDVFVTKLNSSGSDLIYSTYLGGDSLDQSTGIAVDASGNAYVTGYTSGDFPTTGGAYQTAFGGGAFDAFVTKLNATGTRLVYSTYLGGPGQDETNGIALDHFGNAYIAGYSSDTFPTTVGAYQTINQGGEDAFVSKLDTSGTVLLYSTYIGGSGDEVATGIAIQGPSRVYVTGYTFPRLPIAYPTTSGAYQTSNAGQSDGFLTELSSEESALVYSSYIGGLSYDEPSGVAIDSSGYPYITGANGFGGYPITQGAFQSLYHTGKEDAFVTKFDLSRSLVSLQIDSATTSVCRIASIRCTVFNNTIGILVIDSAIIAQPFQVTQSQLPLRISPDSIGQVTVQLITQTGGKFSAPIKFYYHTSTGALHDTTVTITATALSGSGDVANATNSSTKTVQPLTAVDLPVNLTLSNTRVLDTMLVEQIDFAVSFDSDLLNMNPAKLANEVIPPAGLTFGSASISGGLLHVTLKNPAGTKLTDTLSLGDLLFTAYKGAANSTLVTLSALSVTTPNSTYNYCTQLEGDFLANIIVQGSGVTQSVTNSSIRVFPNPSSTGMVALELISEKAATYQIAVYDVLGRAVGSQSARLNAGEKRDLALPTSGFAPGNYYVRISDGASVQTKKIVIE